MSLADRSPGHLSTRRDAVFGAVIRAFAVGTNGPGGIAGDKSKRDGLLFPVEAGSDIGRSG